MIEAIENSAFATFVRESPTLFGYTAVLSLHAIGLAIVAGVNAVVALRLLGIAREIPLRPVVKLFPLMYAGFWVNALSGVALLSANASGMLVNTMFWIKMVFIALAVAVMRVMRQTIFSDAALAGGGVENARGRQLAFASLVCWTGAIIAGRMTAYPYFVKAWFGI
ncbi:MAG: hypothetical protein PVG24_02540 [Gammaproteobacteria bacterium]|jgi:hypothetical protein